MADPKQVGNLTRKVNPSISYQGNTPASLFYSANFATIDTYIIDLTLQQSSELYGVPRTIYVNNGDNPNGVDITVEGTQWGTTIPAYAIGFFPIDATLNDKITLYSPAGGPVVGVTFYNFIIPPYVWYTIDPLTPGFDVQAVTPTATLITNRNTTLLAGVAANVFPAVANARNCRFSNWTDEVLFYQVNATATGSFAAGDKQLMPGESFDMPYRTALRISFYSASGGNVEGEEWTV